MKRGLTILQHRSFSIVSDVAQAQTTAAFSYCVQQVRQYDSDNYVWMVQLPKELRRPIFALRAFNIESVLIGDHVQSKAAPLVQLRFQWWRDALDALFRGQGSPEHPVVLALRDILQKQAAEGENGPRIKKYNLKRILDCREEDLLDAQPPLSVEGLEKYAEGSTSQLLYLQLAAAGVVSRDADHAASHLGKAVGIATLLKGTAYHARARRAYLPVDLCAEHGVSQEDVYSGSVSEGLRDVVLRVASTAKAHLDEARSLQGKLPVLARHLMLPSLPCEAFLKALEAADFDPFHSSLNRGGPSSMWHVMRVKWHLIARSY